MSLAKRGIAAAALAAVAMGIPAAPALAEPDDVELGVYFSDVLIAAGSAGTSEYVVVLTDGPVLLHDFTIKVDFTDLEGIATASADSGAGRECSTAGSVLTCIHTYPLNLFGPTAILPEIVIKPADGAEAGASGSLKVTISAKDVDAVSTEAEVTVGEGVDLGAGDPIELTAAPGDSIGATLQVNNVGDTDADGAVAVFFSDYPFTTTKQHGNCSYADDQLKACEFDEVLTAGLSYVTGEQLPLALRPDTQAPGGAWMEILWMTPAEFELFKAAVGRFDPSWPGEPGSGPRLTLVEKPGADRRGGQVDIDPSNNWSTLSVEVTGDNPFDLAAIGDSGAGAVGEIVPLELGLKNLGPATIDNGRSAEPIGKVNITLPPGSALAEMPEQCIALRADGSENWDNPGDLGAKGIACWTEGYLLRAGEAQTLEVKLRITEAIPNATGKVKVVSPFCEDCEPADDTPGNNEAPVVLNAEVGLPVTGVQVGLIAGVGALLLALGSGVFLLTRRRRTSIE